LVFFFFFLYSQCLFFEAWPTFFLFVAAVALDGEFKVYLPRLLPLLLQVFETDDSDKRQPTLEVLTALKKFGVTLEEYLHLVIPVIVRLFERVDIPIALRKVCQQFLLLFFIFFWC